MAHLRPVAGRAFNNAGCLQSWQSKNDGGLKASRDFAVGGSFEWDGLGPRGKAIKGSVIELLAENGLVMGQKGNRWAIMDGLQGFW